MAKSSPAPELVEAYRLIKSGQRQAAGRLLKEYLTANKNDAQAWWLMAHTVSNPEHVQKCLETVLRLDPQHEKARARLDQLKAPALEEPDDSLFFGDASAPAAPAAPRAVSEPPRPVSRPAPRAESRPVSRPAPRAESRPPEPAPSFEEFAAAPNPFAPPTPGDDPFAGVPAATLPTSDTAGFFGEGVFSGSVPPIDPNRPRPPQPSGPAANAGFEDFDVAPRKSGVEAAIGYGLIGIALIVLLGLIAYLAVNGLEKKNNVPAMATLDGGSFTIEFPKSWDTECLREALGYSVCGIANDPYYNEAEYYATQNIDIGERLAAAFSMAFTGGELPDEQVSIIVMDVPTTSSSYDNGSWAKTSYEMVRQQQEWGFTSRSADVQYDKQEITIDGQTAYYYEYILKDPVAERQGWSGKEAAYDVYIPHDGIMLWLRVDIHSGISDRDYHDTIQAMIQSIHLKPVGEW